MSIPAISAADARSAFATSDAAQAAYLDNLFDDLSALIPVTNINPALVASTGWTVSFSSAYIWGKIVFLSFVADYTGANIAAHATGDITNVTIATFVSAAVPRPLINASAAVYLGHPTSVPITSGGVIVGGVTPNRIFATGTGVCGSAMWISA